MLAILNFLLHLGFFYCLEDFGVYKDEKSGSSESRQQELKPLMFYFQFTPNQNIRDFPMRHISKYLK